MKHTKRAVRGVGRAPHWFLLRMRLPPTRIRETTVTVDRGTFSGPVTQTLAHRHKT